MNSRKLYKTCSKGGIRVWYAEAVNDEVHTYFGSFEGKIQQSIVKCTPKNVGKANQITAHEQAVLEVERLYKKKQEGGYGFDLNNRPQILKPMLAEVYKSQDISNWLVQPKLDGFRCLVSITGGQVNYTSRSNLAFENLKHLDSDFLNLGLQDGWVLDGELYIHGVDFNDLSGWIRSVKDETKLIEFWAFDLITPDSLTFKQREAKLAELNFTDKIKVVSSIKIDNLEVQFQNSLDNGFEGVMLRNPESFYEHKRSKNLLKFKPLLDHEFKIIGYKLGVGKFKEVVTFVCDVPEVQGKVEAVIATTKENQARIFLEKDNLIGQWLTIEFQGYSKYGIPRFPRGKGIRHELG